jgi:hypothetical protein
MAGTLIVSNLKTDTDNSFIVRSNTGTTLFVANTTGIDVANSFASSSITSDKILTVANTKISGNIISSQITSVANTQITGNITSSQITSNPTLYGNVSVTGVIAVGGATPTTNGSGITFPATQSASSDANTLDDYEEGTFTPTAYGGTTAGTTTYTVQQGSYTKIGRQVTVSIRIDYSALTGTGELRFGGFPFTTANDSMEYTGVVMTNTLNWTSGSAIGIYFPPNSTFCVIFNLGDDASWGGQLCTNETVGIRSTMTYFV